MTCPCPRKFSSLLAWITRVGPRWRLRMVSIKTVHREIGSSVSGVAAPYADRSVKFIVMRGMNGDAYKTCAHPFDSARSPGRVGDQIDLNSLRLSQCENDED